MQVVLGEHALQAIMRHSGQLAPGQFGDSAEIEQLALREQDKQRTDSVLDQHSLNLARRGQAFVVHDFVVADSQFFKQLPDYRRRMLRIIDVGDFCHELCPNSYIFEV